MRTLLYTLSVGFIVLIVLFHQSCERDAYIEGRALYNEYCANCHQEDGSGLAALYPPLNQSLFVDGDLTGLACMIRNGRQGQSNINGIAYTQKMPGIEILPPIAITNIANYISREWGSEQYITLQAVQEELEACSQ